jgi:MSHA biogenesis protein MshI
MSASAVALAVADGDGDRLRVAAVPIEGGAGLVEATAGLVGQLGAKGATCVVVVAPDVYQLLLIEQPNVAAAEMRDAVRWRIQEYLDIPAADAVIDVFPFPESASRGRAPMVFVVATAKARIETTVRHVTEAGLTPVCVDIAELALRNLTQRIYPSPEHAIALLRITNSSGIINITRGDELFLSRRISGVPRGLDQAAWDPFKDALLLQVQRSIDYYESALSQAPADCLLVAATHGWQERIVEHLESMLALPVRALGGVLTDALALRLFNPQAEDLAEDTLTASQDQALAAALPALGAALRAIDMAVLRT